MGKHRDIAVASLRSLVVSGEIERGRTFSETEIADRFGVSRTPVREAVAILVREGLLDQIPQVGVTVHVFSEDEIHDILNTREMMETHVTGRLAELPASAEDVAALTRLMEEMDQAAGLGDRRAFLEADAKFHTEIARRAHFSLAAEMLENISDKIRIVGLDALFREDGMRIVLAEHQAILDAIRVHNDAAASEAMKVHLDMTRQRLEQSWRDRVR